MTSQQRGGIPLLPVIFADSPIVGRKAGKSKGGVFGLFKFSEAAKQAAKRILPSWFYVGILRASAIRENIPNGLAIYYNMWMRGAH